MSHAKAKSYKHRVGNIGEPLLVCFSIGLASGIVIPIAQAFELHFLLAAIAVFILTIVVMTVLIFIWERRCKAINFQQELLRREGKNKNLKNTTSPE